MVVSNVIIAWKICPSLHIVQIPFIPDSVLIPNANTLFRSAQQIYVVSLQQACPS